MLYGDTPKAVCTILRDSCREQTTTPGTPCPTLYEKCMGSFMSHRVTWSLLFIIVTRED